MAALHLIDEFEGDVGALVRALKFLSVRLVVPGQASATVLANLLNDVLEVCDALAAAE